MCCIYATIHRYRWAFIGGAVAGETDKDVDEDVTDQDKKKKEVRRKQAVFNPHIIRLARLLNSKVNTNKADYCNTK